MTNIRPAVPADLLSVSRLMRETWLNAYWGFIPIATIERVTGEWHSVDRLARQLANPALVFLVAEDELGIAGHAAAAIEQGDEVFLRRLYVHPRAQAQGIGRQLFVAIDAAFPAGAPMRLEAFGMNERAITFYRRLGFEITPDTLASPKIWEGIAEIQMTRPRR
jgi:GNAT superfamily N-acetyltransferase